MDEWYRKEYGKDRYLKTNKEILVNHEQVDEERDRMRKNKKFVIVLILFSCVYLVCLYRNNSKP